MIVEVIFVDFAKGLAADLMKDGLREAFRALVEQEILATDLNRLVSEPFRTACTHLEHAAVEPEGSARQREFVELARREFTKASNQEAPLPAVRAAFYAGLCHRMLNEPIHEALCYRTSLRMAKSIESDLQKKLTPPVEIPALAILTKVMRVVDPLHGLARIPLDMYLQGVRTNLGRQLETVREHSTSIEAVMKTRGYSAA